LTDSQKKAIEDIRKDFASGFAMRRLIQGDVGSGKTLVAFLSMADTVKSGYQCAMMAPTEVLAKQHFDKLSADNEKYELGLKPVLLTGSLTAAKKRAAYELIENGEADCIIGTHAVFQEKVNFKNLALVITDEQHRFGVKQRESLSGKGDAPHVLIMSATPIPRTLTMTLYADLSVTVMKDLPNKRLPIKSCIIDAKLRNNAFNFIEQEVKAGHQAYIICPMVEESEDSDLENVTDYPNRLIQKFGDKISYRILHGRMKQAEKNEVMDAFAEGKVDVLISTTVVEVGVDVPNATVILIENAERFGLAQLHQLRGRVGRGDAQSYCIFIDGTGKCEENERLSVLKSSNDGFFIAEEDLRLRGPGDLDGLRQSGEMSFAIADIIRDYDILMMAKEYVENADE
jgi:ATP-dependent DNA helicase RecG